MSSRAPSTMCSAGSRRLLGDPPYNLVIHTAPAAARPGYHWYVRITPRLTVTAGFERGSGLFVNIVPPENAAAALRAEAGAGAAP